MLKKKLITLIIVSFLTVGTGVTVSAYTKKENEINEYNNMVDEYNSLVESYNQLVTEVSIANIEDFDTEYSNKEYFKGSSVTSKQKNSLKEDLSNLAFDYLVINQINNPDEDWVINKLEEIEDIISIEAVTEDNDPNGLLAKEKGYSSCIYFTTSSIDQDLFDSTNTVDKGTDAGGCIEVYRTLEDAQDRIDYLAQFDDTILCPGSYALLGTMVIRTSFMLSDKQQITLTNDITESFTTVDE